MIIAVQYGSNTTPVKPQKKIDEQGEPLKTTSGDGDTIKWTENTMRMGVTDVKKGSRKDKREVLREERRRVEKRPVSRLQMDNGHSVQSPHTLSEDVTEAIRRRQFHRPLQLGLHVSTLRTIA